MRAVTPTTPRPRLRLLVGLVAAVAYLVDLLTKTLAVAHLPVDAPPRHLVGSLLQLHLIRNPGAAFSTGTAYTSVLSVVAVVAAVAVLWFARRVGDVAWAGALGFLLAGILGNLTDRVFRAPSVFSGHVVDFLELPHWPIFNVADVCINVAVVLILVQVFRGVRLDGSRPDRDVDADAPAPAPDRGAAS